MKKRSIFNIAFVFLITNLSAQSVCQEQLEMNNAVGGDSIGQSIFMSGCSGFFSSIELNRSDDGPEIIVELKIFTGQTFIGTPRYTQNVTIPQVTGPFTINLDGGTGDLAFFQDSQYTFILYISTLVLEASSNVDSYADGQMFLDVGFINSDDLWFKLSTVTTLGIDGHELKKPSLFPNPAKGYLQISGLDAQEAFTIYNVLGTKVKNGIIYKDEKLDIQNLPIGLYYLKLNDGETLKFIKK